RPRNPDLKYARDRVISHDTIASLWSLMTFSWMTPMIKLGNLRSLAEDDLWELPSRCQAAHCYYELDRTTNLDLLSRLLYANATNLILFLVIAILRSIFAFTTPYFLYQLLNYISEKHPEEYSEKPYLYLLGILVSELCRIIFLNQLNYQVVWLGIRVEQMLSVLVYEKQLRLMASPPEASINNKANNVLTTDVDDIAGFFSNFPFLLTTPLEIIVAIVYLYFLLGWYSLVGVAIIVICTWSNKRFGKRVTRLQKRVKKARDERVGEIFEPLQTFPNLVAELIGLSIAVSRVEKFLNETEIQKEGSTFSSDSTRTTGWLENTTIRENILFGTDFEEERYWDIVDSCGLTKDFENMEEADFTEYDEKSLLLTNEQKSRIALARALYSPAQILLIDDCLSCPDSDTAQQIIDHCLRGPLVSGRTVIIATRYARYLLDMVDYVAILREGSVQAKGTPEEVHDSGFLTDDVLGKDVKSAPDQVDKNDQYLEIEKSTADRRNWTAEEVRSQGKISFQVYLFYLKSSGGLFLWFILFILFISIRTITVGETYWLKKWTDLYPTKKGLNYDLTFHEQSFDDEENSNLKSIGVYALIAIASSVFTIIRMHFQISLSLKGSRSLFSELLNSILRAPLSFFDTAPLGRVMNRFSKDLGIIDQGLVTVISGFLGDAVGAMSVLVVVTAVIYEFGIVSIIVGQ
ncbi:12021_t:CDS:2, partial [Acaulospora colombiana]